MPPVLDSALAHRLSDAVDVPQLLELARGLVRIKSYTGSAGEVDAAHYLAHQLRARDLAPQLQAVDEQRFNVLARAAGSGGGRSLMLNGHMDTNPVVLGWTRDPFAGEVEDGWMYGLGVCNMKAALAAYVAAYDAVRRVGLRPRGDVVFAFVVGEQQGGVGTLKLLQEGLRTDYFIDGEPCALSVLTLHAGVVALKIHVLGRMRHLSKMEEAINAIDKMYTVIDGLKRLRFSSDDRPDYRGLQRVNVSAIKGGMGREYMDWRTGIVPDFCTIFVDVRIAPGQDERSVLADVERLLAELRAGDPQLHTEVELIGPPQRHHFPPFEVSRDAEIVGIVADAARMVTGAEPEIGSVAPYKFYGTDAAHLSRAGIQGVVCGPGGKKTTSPDEAVEVDELVNAARIYALTIAAICG
ncbi:MAG: M20/M25/M40 family metallo-hydrolase [Chloroflexota bacterium]|nr:M20/M25/M40 family metallo-hydrolase [Chloroflexota bacterium]